MSKRLKIVLITAIVTFVLVFVGTLATTRNSKVLTAPTTTAAPATTTTTTTTVPATLPPTTSNSVQAIQDWWNSEQPRINNIVNDARGIGRDAGNGNYTALNTDCVLLQNDTQSMMGQAIPAAVSSSVARPFQTALVDYNRAAILCQQAITNVSASEMLAAVKWMQNGNNQVANATNAIQVIKGY